MMYLIEGGCGVLCCQLETSRVPPAETGDWLLVYWGRREMEEDADPSDVWVAGLTSKETHTQLVLGAGKMNRSRHPRSGILRVYTEAFSHIDSLDSLNITSVSQDQDPENSC